METLDQLLPAQPLNPGLYVAATPIGNMEDITLRALRVLRDCDAIACEDTRMTMRLVQRYGLCRTLLPYHEHNSRQALPGLLRRLAEGQASVNEIAAPFKMSQPAVSRHLKVLERAGLIERDIDEQRRPARLKAENLIVAVDWLAEFRAFWGKSFDQLDDVLATMKQQRH